jgi:hypothetical protein
MSELKSYKLFHRASALISPEFISIVEFGNGDEVYLKSEADKVIAEKDKEIAELKGDNERLRGESCKLTDGCLRLKQCRKEKANIADELRHQKRERCLAMAMWCFEKSYSTTLVKYDEKSGLLRNFYDWWGKRWLELAEKFKEAK